MAVVEAVASTVPEGAFMGQGWAEGGSVEVRSTEGAGTPTLGCRGAGPPVVLIVGLHLREDFMEARP